LLRDAGGTASARSRADRHELRKAIDEKHGDVLKKADAALEEAKKAGGLSAETKKPASTRR
jgi:hypothetical protein